MSDEINPYQSPVPGEPESASVSGEYSAHIDSSRRPFVPATRWAIATCICLAMDLVLEGGNLLLYARAYQYYTQAAEIPQLDSGMIDYLFQYEVLVLTGINLMQLVTGLLLVRWMYVGHRNLEALGHDQLDTKAVLAVLGWFIPVLNLFCPFIVMREIWWRSDPMAGNTRDSARSSDLVLWWWMVWVSALVTAFWLNWFVTRSESLSQMLLDLRGNLALSVFRMIAAVLLILVIRGIDQNQRERNRRILSGDLVLPPLPSDE